MRDDLNPIKSEFELGMSLQRPASSSFRTSRAIEDPCWDLAPEKLGAVLRLPRFEQCQTSALLGYLGVELSPNIQASTLCGYKGLGSFELEYPKDVEIKLDCTRTSHIQYIYRIA